MHGLSCSCKHAAPRVPQSLVYRNAGNMTKFPIADTIQKGDERGVWLDSLRQFSGSLVPNHVGRIGCDAMKLLASYHEQLLAMPRISAQQTPSAPPHPSFF